MDKEYIELVQQLERYKTMRSIIENNLILGWKKDQLELSSDGQEMLVKYFQIIDPATYKEKLEKLKKEKEEND